MALPTPRRSVRNLARACVKSEDANVSNKTLVISLSRIPLPPVSKSQGSTTIDVTTTKTTPIPISPRSTSKAPDISSTSATTSTANRTPEDDLYWQDKIDTLNYCVICLERNAITKGSDEFATMDHIWPYLRVSDIFSEYLFIVGKVNDGIYLESRVPPMCKSCLDDIKTLNTLHQKMKEISQKIENRADEIRRKMEGVDFKTVSAKLEGDMTMAKLPFRCMSNAIQFLSQLHRPSWSNARTTPSPRKCPRMINDDEFDLGVRNNNADSDHITPKVDTNSLQVESKPKREVTVYYEDDDFIYEGDDVGVDNSDDVDYDPSYDVSDPLKEKARNASKILAAKSSESPGSNVLQKQKDKSNNCPVCGIFYSKKEKLRLHWWIRHKKHELKEEDIISTSTGPQICECGAKYLHRYSLLFHQDNEKEKCQAQLDKREQNLCRICGKHFNSRKALVKHRQYGHNTRTEDLVCKICDKEFKKAGHFEAHILEHSKPPKTAAELSAVCEVCGKVFRGIKSLEQHKSVHTGEKPFVCNLCGKAFRRNSFLLDHQRCTHWVELGETRPVCEICGKDFANPRYLKEHMVLHGQGRTFPCDECGRVFRKRSNMTGHKKRVHLAKREPQPTHDPDTGKRRPTCKICGKSFASKRYMREHVANVHKQKPKFSCDTCGKKFSSKYDLRYHNLELHMKPLTKDSSDKTDNKPTPVSTSNTDTQNDNNPSTSSDFGTVPNTIFITPEFINEVKDSSPVSNPTEEPDEIIDGHQLIAEITIEHASVVEIVDQAEPDKSLA